MQRVTHTVHNASRVESSPEVSRVRTLTIRSGRARNLDSVTLFIDHTTTINNIQIHNNVRRDDAAKMNSTKTKQKNSIETSQRVTHTGTNSTRDDLAS